MPRKPKIVREDGQTAGRSVTGIQNQHRFDMRRIRERVMATFDRIGGEERLDAWAAEHFDRFLFEILIPLMPPHVDAEGLELKDGHPPGQIKFDEKRFREYMAERGKKPEAERRKRASDGAA
jgi:hypothetical protein